MIVQVCESGDIGGYAGTYCESIPAEEARTWVELPGQGVDVLSPPSDAAAPPGYYMLFLLDSTGVPSVAKWIKLEEKQSGGGI